MIRGLFSHIALNSSFKKTIKFQFACVAIIIIIIIVCLI